jgi:hypothetical protein
MADEILYYEAGRTLVAFEQLTDDGAHKEFMHSSIQYLSNYSTDTASYGPTVRPDGVRSGGNGTPGTANDTVDVTALNAYLAGVWYGTGGDSAAVAATTLTITRGTVTTNPYKVNSVTLASSGAFVVVEGSGGTNFTTVDSGRGGAGQPPLIPLKSIECFQVRTTSSTAAVILASEIQSTPGTHREEAANPTPITRFSRETNHALGYCGVSFLEALPLIHTGSVTKGIWMKGYEASFSEWPDVRGFFGTDETGSLASEPFYRRAIGSVDKTLNAGAFEWGVGNPVTDAQLEAIGREVWFKFLPDSLQTAAIIVQGYVFGTPPNPATGVNVSSMSVLATEKYKRIF